MEERGAALREVLLGNSCKEVRFERLSPGVCVILVFEGSYLTAFDLKRHLVKDLFQVGIAVTVIITARIGSGVEGCLLLG